MRSFLSFNRFPIITRFFSSGFLILFLGVLLAILPVSLLAQQTSGPYVYVSSRDDNSVKRYDAATGAFIDNFVTPGSGGLVRPQEVVFGPDGHLYVTGFSNPNIKKYDRDTGAYLGEFSTGFNLSQPTKMTFHDDGYIYVSQWGGQRKVVRFNMNTGAFVDEFTSSGVVGGCGHAWDDGGFFYVVGWGSNGNNGTVQRFDAEEGTFIDVFVQPGVGGLAGPVNIWYADNDLFVVDWTRGQVKQYDTETSAFKGNFISGLVNTEGFTFDKDGFIYLCDWQIDRVNRYHPDGSFDQIFINSGNSLGGPNSVTFGPNEITAIEPRNDIIPMEFQLSQNFPNPFNPSTQIQISLPSAQVTTLKIYNALGQEMATLLNNHLTAGEYQVEWDAGNSPGGVYYYQLTAGSFSETKKMILLR